jgi:hypothetical protein
MDRFLSVKRRQTAKVAPRPGDLWITPPCRAGLGIGVSTGSRTCHPAVQRQVLEPPTPSSHRASGTNTLAPPIRPQDRSPNANKPPTRCGRFAPALPKPVRPRRLRTPQRPESACVGRSAKPAPPPEDVHQVRELSLPLQLPPLQSLTILPAFSPTTLRLPAGYNVASGGLRESDFAPRKGLPDTPVRFTPG